MSVAIELPRWHMNHEIHAAPIIRVAEGLVTVQVGAHIATYDTSPEWQQHWSPEPGKYLVLFPWGTTMCMSAETFEKAHTPA